MGSLMVMVAQLRLAGCIGDVQQVAVESVNVDHVSDLIWKFGKEACM